MTQSRDHQVAPSHAGETSIEAASSEGGAEPASARFSAAGPRPPVAPGGGGGAGPSASELAYGVAPDGPGVKALEALFAAGAPKPEDVVEVIDAHRAETPAMYAWLGAKHGAAFVQEVRDAMGLRASIDRREVVAGDPTDPEGGHFYGSASERGARWRTSDGRFSGTAGKTGLDASYRLDDDDALHARVDRRGAGTLAWERDGRTEGELYRSESELGLRRDWELGGGDALTTGVRRREHGGAPTDEAFAVHRTADGRTATTGALGVRDGQPAGLLGVTHRAGERDTYSGELTHDARGTMLAASGTHGLDGGASISGRTTLHHGPDGTTGALAGTYRDPDRQIDGSITRAADHTALHVGARERLSPELALTGSLDHVDRDAGADQSTLRLGERYRSGQLVHGLDLEAGRGDRDYFAATGSLDAQLGDRLYAGAFGSYRTENGQQDQARLGASLTFTPHEKAALTLAGVLDETGALETRLQLDVFKSRLGGVGDLADHKKDALVSLFVSYSTAGSPHRLDDRFGAPQAGTPEGERVMAGIRIRF